MLVNLQDRDNLLTKVKIPVLNVSVIQRFHCTYPQNSQIRGHNQASLAPVLRLPSTLPRCKLSLSIDVLVSKYQGQQKHKKKTSGFASLTLYMWRSEVISRFMQQRVLPAIP